MEHALPRRTAGTPRSWSLLLTSENHGAVGPLGSTFPHAGEKHERVQVVEIVAAGSPPAPGVDLSGLMRFGFCDINDDEFVERPDGAYFLAHQVEARVSSIPAANPVGEFKGYVDGEPAVAWLDRDNMPRVGTKLFASAAPASTVLTDDEDLLDVVRTLCAVAARRGELVPERLKHYPHVDEEGSPVLVAARAACVARGYTEDGLSVEGVIYPVAAQAGQVAVPEEALRVVRRLLDGSQPKDLAGAIMVIDSALNGGAAWTYDIDPPAGFLEYVQANYSGDVMFHDHAWHARRLWNAAMRNLSKSSSGSAQASTSGERQEGGAA